MPSSKGFRIYLRDSGAATWREITRFVNPIIQCYQNVIPTFSCEALITDASTQALVRADTVFRITNEVSTNGACQFWHNGTATGEAGAAAGSYEIITGRLSDPIRDEKTQASNTPRVYRLSGSGFVETVGRLTYDADVTFSSQTAKQIIETHANSILTTVGASNLVAGTIDTGPTLSFVARKDEVLGLLMEIAKAGDVTNLFPYYVDITHNASFIPTLNYYAPNNAIYETANPFSPRDDGRILDDKTELQTFYITRERDRIINSVKVRYAGFGTGATQADTAVATDTTFSEVRQAIIYSPLLQDNASGVILRDTVLNTFKGTATGLIRTEAVLKDPRLFTSAFDAVLGDQIGIERSGSEVIQGKFLGFEYKFPMGGPEQLMVVIGLPRNPFFEDYSNLSRIVRRMLSGLKTSVSKRIGSVEVLAGQPAIAGNIAVAPGASNFATLNFTDRFFFAETDEGIQFYFQIFSRNTGTPNGVSAKVDVLLTDNAANVLYEAAEYTTAGGVGNAGKIQKPVFFGGNLLRTFVGPTGTITAAVLTIINREAVTIDFDVQLYAWVEAPHFHDM